MQAEQEDRFQEFVRARWSRLVRTAYLLTGDVHHAEDLTQTALAKAYRSWRRISRSDSPEAYVRRMLVTCNSDRFRKRRVTEALTAAPPDRAGRDEGAGQVEERGSLLAGLAQLPPRQRAVVVLRYWEDLSEAEVAEVLGCSTGTVKSQASKGLAKLRTYPGLSAGRTPTDGRGQAEQGERGDSGERDRRARGLRVRGADA
ncbi:SigE family RNA polymerase sigma factor [Streptomyces sp. NPDC054884]|uniref:SigE family RNA polymerase sigma factor n=1 Tax=Streptomyces sp. ME08-AFT2 TaxID=3028683 RepID=UPI0029A30BAF|nr:SigE family RNA polymerase sigma factor [Streptomyces sp. ME08-AFT2]MDX3311122.1 SigE family RNA polymerase sigma factor [Streptomyces sp. ME08-AFT2]